MIVVDASVLTNTLIYADDRGRKARAILAKDTEWAAPEHWKVEVFSAIRGLALGGKVSQERAVRALTRMSDLGVDHVPVDSLVPRMWALRGNVSGYDAAYVALAEVRGLTLVTADGRLAKTATQYCRVEYAN